MSFSRPNKSFLILCQNVKGFTFFSWNISNGLSNNVKTNDTSEELIGLVCHGRYEIGSFSRKIKSKFDD